MEPSGGLLTLLGVIALYFLPWIWAVRVGHRQTAAIGALNLFLGWTLVGWVAAMVWALTKPGARS